MYNTKVICTYNTPGVFLETDDITDEEKEFVRDAIYRQEFLDVLEIEDYDEELMSRALHNLWEQLKESAELRKCMVKMAGTCHMESNEETGLMLLFAYEHMYLTHVCVSEYLETGQITKTNLDKLNERLI